MTDRRTNYGNPRWLKNLAYRCWLDRRYKSGYPRKLLELPFEYPRTALMEIGEALGFREQDERLRYGIDLPDFDGLPVREEGAIHKIRPLNRHELKQIPTFPPLPDYGEMSEEEKKEQWRKYAYMDWIAPRDLYSERLNHFVARNTSELLSERKEE